MATIQVTSTPELNAEQTTKRKLISVQKGQRVLKSALTEGRMEQIETTLKKYREEIDRLREQIQVDEDRTQRSAAETRVILDRIERYFL